MRAGEYERIGAKIDRDFERNPIQPDGRPRYLPKEARDALEPFAALVYQAMRDLRGLTDDGLAALTAAIPLTSPSNCGWAKYEVAHWPWFLREVEYERRCRAEQAAVR